MPDQRRDIATTHMQAITISREYGSGGGEVARRLANRLNWRLLDHEAVIRVAERLNISQAEAEESDEHGRSLGEKFLDSCQFIQPTMSAGLPALLLGHSEQTYHAAYCEVIKAAYRVGHVVIVGRGSQMLLSQERDVLHIRVVTPLQQRIVYVMQREQLSREAALERIRIKDQGRMRYLQALYQQKPANPLLYDITLNTTILSLDRIVDIVLAALAYKNEQLEVPEAQLGPVAGLSAYPGQTSDFCLLPQTESENAG